MNQNEHNTEWKTWSEALQLFCHGVTLRTCIPVALIVGVILTTINQSDVILSGTATTVTWMKVGMDFVVPFCVSSYGFLNGCRIKVEAPITILNNEIKS